MIKRKFKLVLFTALVFLSFSLCLHAQGDPPEPPDGGGGPGGVDDVPIDDHIFLCLIIGVIMVGWVFKRLRVELE